MSEVATERDEVQRELECICGQKIFHCRKAPNPDRLLEHILECPSISDQVKLQHAKHARSAAAARWKTQYKEKHAREGNRDPPY